MEQRYYDELVLIRMERAEELLRDAEKLLDSDSYKSANNRAYYAMEKAVTILVIIYLVNSVSNDTYVYEKQAEGI